MNKDPRMKYKEGEKDDDEETCKEPRLMCGDSVTPLLSPSVGNHLQQYVYNAAFT